MTVPIAANAYGWDRALAAMFCRAKAGETVSIMAARSQVRGDRWGCVLCRVLDVLVARGHCIQALDTGDGATSGWAAIRSGLLLTLVFLVLLAPLLALGFWAGRVL